MSDEFMLRRKSERYDKLCALLLRGVDIRVDGIRIGDVETLNASLDALPEPENKSNKPVKPPRPPIRCCMATFQTVEDWQNHASPLCRPKHAQNRSVTHER